MLYVVCCIREVVGTGWGLLRYGYGKYRRNMNRLTSKASWTILPNTIRTGVWLSVAKAGALWK